MYHSTEAVLLTLVRDREITESHPSSHSTELPLTVA